MQPPHSALFIHAIETNASLLPILSFLCQSHSPFILSVISPPGFLSAEQEGELWGGGGAVLQFDKCMFSKHSNYLNQS